MDGERRSARLNLGDPAYTLRFDTPPDEEVVFQGGQPFRLSLFAPGEAAAGGVSDGKLLAPMPGRVVALAVAAGQRVAKGAPVVTLEAMKMEHGLVAPFDAVVAETPVTVGQQVSEGALLARLQRAED